MVYWRVQQDVFGHWQPEGHLLLWAYRDPSYVVYVRQRTRASTRTHTHTHTQSAETFTVISSRLFLLLSLLNIPRSLPRLTQPLINVCVCVCVCANVHTLLLCVWVKYRKSASHSKVLGLKRKALLHYLNLQLSVFICVCSLQYSRRNLPVMSFVATLNKAVALHCVLQH